MSTTSADADLSSVVGPADLATRMAQLAVVPNVKQQEILLHQEFSFPRPDLHPDPPGEAAEEPEPPLDMNMREEMQGALQLIVVGRRLLQPSKRRSGYALFATAMAGEGIGLKGTVFEDSHENYTVVFPPSTDPSHPTIGRPKCITEGMWQRIFSDIEPVTEFHNTHPVQETDFRFGGLSGVEYVRQHPADRDHIDVTGGLLLFELDDMAYEHPIYLGNAFIQTPPVPMLMQGYDVRDIPSSALATWMLEQCEPDKYQVIDNVSDTESDKDTDSEADEGLPGNVSDDDQLMNTVTTWATAYQAEALRAGLSAEAVPEP